MAYIQKASATAVPVVNAVETIAVTALPYIYDLPNTYVGGEHTGPGTGVSITGIINMSVIGTAGTSLSIRVRQGPLVTGTQVGPTITATVAAGSTYDFAYDFVDATRFCAQQGGGVYVVTVQVNAATAGSTVGYATLTLEGQ